MALFQRLISHGLCTYKDISSPGLTEIDVFTMLRFADWKDYVDSFARIDGGA